MSQSIEGFYPFLILIVVLALKGLGKRAKKRKEKKLAGAKPVMPATPPKVNVLESNKVGSSRDSILKVTKLSKPLRKKQTRVGKLIGGLNSKKELIFLSEILVNKRHIR